MRSSSAHRRMFSGCYTQRVNQIAERITVDPEQCGGRPCVRGMRIRVSDGYLRKAHFDGRIPEVEQGAGNKRLYTAENILEEMPDLEPEDLQACLRFASRYLDHPVLVG